MSFRSWLSVITIVLLFVVVFFSRHEIARAWQLLESVNIGILLLLIPVQVFGYLTAGEMMFSYLRAKDSIKNVSLLEQGRMALEMNFVNHALPSGGVSGVSYMTWRLGNYGVAPSRAAAAQLIRYLAGFVSLVMLLIVSVFFITIDGSVNRVIILLSSAMVFLMVASLVGTAFIVGNKTRMEKAAAWVVRTSNKVVKFVTFGKKQKLVKRKPILKFFTELNGEYVTVMQNRKLFLRPFLWGIIFNALDILLFYLTFLALGHSVSPAAILIGYGLASIAGFVVITPGGAGAYEAIMVAVLTTSGITPGLAIAGILLTRVIILLITIVVGYFFYQHALLRYGKSRTRLFR